MVGTMLEQGTMVQKKSGRVGVLANFYDLLRSLQLAKISQTVVLSAGTAKQHLFVVFLRFSL